MGKLGNLLKKTPPTRPTIVTRSCGCQTVNGLPTNICATDMRRLG